MKAVRVNLFGGSSTKQRPDSEPRSLGDHGSVFRFLGSQLEGKILRGPMCLLKNGKFKGCVTTEILIVDSTRPVASIFKLK